MRVIDLINVSSVHLNENGFDNSRLEVERMLGFVLGLSRINLYMEFDRPLSGQELNQFRGLYKRRLACEPLQYIISTTGFRDLEVKTNNRVFIPRPETELLVQIAVDFLKMRSDPLVADLGTGSGVIALSVVYEVPGAHVVAVDVSDDALMLTENNARKLGVEKWITLVSGDMLGGIKGRGSFDAILSNPPYIKSGHIKSLHPEIRDHEPKTALDGGHNGLTYLNAIAEGASQFLKNGGLLLLECEGEQANKVKKIIENTHSYSLVEIIRDLAGKNRIVRALCN